MGEAAGYEADTPPVAQVRNVLCYTGVEKLQAQTLWGDRGDQNKDSLLRNHMSEMHPCSATDSQIGSD